MYEWVMSEWHIPFDHIEEHWTDMQFLSFVLQLNKRMEKQNESMRTSSTKPIGKKQSYSDWLRDRGVV